MHLHPASEGFRSGGRRRQGREVKIAFLRVRVVALDTMSGQERREFRRAPRSPRQQRAQQQDSAGHNVEQNFGGHVSVIHLHPSTETDCNTPVPVQFDGDSPSAMLGK